MALKSLKELGDKRARLLTEAKGIQDRARGEDRQLSTDELAQVDKILDKAGDVDADIEARRQADRQADRLREFREREREDLPRQVSAVQPGLAPSKGGAEALTVDLGRAGSVTIQPGTPEYERCSLKYREAFVKYLTGHGRHEQLGLQVSKDTKGGYLAPPQFVAKFIKFVDDLVFMREISTVLPPMPEAVSIGVPTWTADPGDADWTAEIPSSDIAEDDTATLGRREFMPHLLTKLLKVSKKLLRSSVLDLETFLAQRLAYKFAITEEKAYLTGTGNQQPLGVFVASADGIPSTQDTTCASATVFTYAELVTLFETLKQQYQANATWLVSRGFVRRARQLVDLEGQPLWSGGLGGQALTLGMADTILGRPYKVSEYVPSTFTTGLYIAAVGDFRTGYWIADSLGMEVQYLGELFALKNQVGYLASKETDGAPVMAEAIVRLKLA